MKAIQITATGGPEVLQYRDLDVPTPARGQVLIEVRAAGINFIDIYFREGRYPSDLPFIPGQEGAGVVVAIGDDVTAFYVGARVAWCGVQGAYAQYAVVPESRVIRMPDSISFEQAAAAMLQGMTAHYLANSTYPLQEGSAVLIHAGAGGVGLLLTQVAKMMGAYVITTASTREKAHLSREAGADHVVLYADTDFAEQAKSLTKGVGVDVVYDGVGKTTFEGSLKALKPRGMLVLFGGASGAVPAFDLARLSTMGSLYVTRPTLAHYTATRAELEWRANDVLHWVEARKLMLRADHVYPLADAAKAQSDLQGRRTTGKLLLIP